MSNNFFPQKVFESDYFKEVRKIEEKYLKAVEDFDTSFPLLINTKSERELFFKKLDKNEVYNPVFIFEKKKYSKKILNQLKKIKVDVRDDIYGFKGLYRKKIKVKIHQYYCFKYWGSVESISHAKVYWGKPNYLLLRKAKKFAKNFKREKVKFDVLSVEEISKSLKEEVRDLTGDSLRINKVVLANKMAIYPLKKLLKINPEVRFTTLDLKRLLVHEIGTHYLRYYNGRKSGINLLASGTYDFIETEEGLAVYMEELEGVLSKAQMYIYAGRVIATYYAQTKSFYEVFNILKRYNYKNADAYALTLRAKRILSDTSQKGGFMKDYVYFSGYYKVKKFARKHDILDLFVGKVGVADLKFMGKYVEKNRSRIVTIFDT